MIRKIMFTLLLLMTVTLAGVQQASATPTYKAWFEANYSAAVNSRIDVCLLCHVDSDPISSGNSDRNMYGANFGRNAHNFTVIEPLDSDGDTFTNIVEILNLTFPGNESDFPPVITSSSPTSPVMDVMGASRTFTVTVNQPLNVIWLINGAQVQSNMTTDANNQSTYTNTSAAQGTWNVSVIAQKAGDGSAMQTWIWNVGAAPISVGTFNISGFKINDTNGNGVWDSGEMGIENWNINLLNATTGAQMANTSTDVQGFYGFMNLAPSTYNVTEEMKAGFISTNATSRMITVENLDAMNVNFTNQPVAPPTGGITAFVLKPNLNTTLKGMPISITITTLNGNKSQMLFNGMADINIIANNVSAVSSPMNVSFTGGNATIQVTSSVAQFVTVTATSATAANTSITGSTQVMFADKVFSLSKGWNLISIPNFADPSSVNQTLQHVQNNGVIGFDPSTGNFTTPTSLEPLFGYWINVTADNQSLGFIASTKIPSMPPTRKLYGGWNLIGVSASRNDPDTLSISQLFVDLKQGSDFTQWLYTRLVSFDQPAAPFTLVVGTDLSDLTFLQQGHGYWLFIKNIQNNNNTNNVPWAGKQW